MPQPPPGLPDKFYTVNQVAELLCVTAQSVYHWAATGDLNVVRIGTGNAKPRIRIPHSEVVRLCSAPKPVAEDPPRLFGAAARKKRPESAPGTPRIDSTTYEATEDAQTPTSTRSEAK